jgi:hypothetical protein
VPTDNRGKLEVGKEKSLPPLVCVEPIEIPIEGVLPARALSRVRPKVHESPRVKPQPSDSETEAPSSCAYVVVANFTNEALTISKASVLGIAEGISESLVYSINSDSDLLTKPGRKKKNESL